MPSCAIISCRARSQVSSVAKGGISFHRFPKEPDIRQQWIDATGREDWIPTKSSTICSRHFDKNDYAVKKSGNKYLKDGAIPCENVVYLHSFTNHQASSSSPSAIETLNSEKLQKRKLFVTCNTEDEIKRSVDQLPSTPEKEKPEQSLQLNLPTCTTTSNASTPRNKILKEIFSTKDTVIKRQKKVIKKIQAQNRRLKKKINKMEDIMNDMQKKALRHEGLSTLRKTNLQVGELFGRYICKDKSGVNKQQYSPNLRKFALTLHYYSPKAYNYVRNTFNTCLPHVRTLREWCSSVNK